MERLLGAKSSVISTGGGAFIQEPIREMVKAQSVSVWLDAEPELLWRHVRLKPGRPLLEKPNPREILETLCRERAPFYAQADIRIEVREDTDQIMVAEQILDALEARGTT